jgi:hypothetical protein
MLISALLLVGIFLILQRCVVKGRTLKEVQG